MRSRLLVRAQKIQNHLGCHQIHLGYFNLLLLNLRSLLFLMF